MSRKRAQQQRLIEVSALIGALTERMMTAYVVGSCPGDAEVRAFCQGVLLLEEHGVALPPFAEDVIGRLQVRYEPPALPPVIRPEPRPAARPSMLDRMFRSLRTLRAA